MKSIHVPVLLGETIEALRAAEGGLFLDCTFGGGGHSKAILEANPENHVIALDRDGNAVERGQANLRAFGDRIQILHAAFSDAGAVAGFARFDGILADLGVSTDQLKGERGFSFADVGDFDMRMDRTQGRTAHQLINEMSEREMFLMLAKGGVGSNAKILAKEILRKRPIADGKALADVVAASGRGKRSDRGVHPATVVFQALRMAVNQEIEQIEALMETAPAICKPGGRLAVITFHSIEDRLVTRSMRDWEEQGQYPAGWRGPREGKSLGKVITRKAVYPSDDEVALNPASRSARLRVFEFLGGAN